MLQIVVQEEVVLFARHAIVHQKLIHFRIQAAAIIEIERKEPLGIHDLGRLDGARIFGMKVFGGFALDENGVRPDFKDGVHRQNVSSDNMFEGGDKSPVGLQLFVPPAERGRKNGADEHFIDGCVKLDPGKAAGECIGILSEEVRELGILKIAQPIRHAEVAQIRNRQDAPLGEITESFVAEGPIVFGWSQKDLMQRNAVAQKADAEIADTLEIGLPLFVVSALLHFVNALAALVNGWVAVFNACREHEEWLHQENFVSRDSESNWVIPTLARRLRFINGP